VKIVETEFYISWIQANPELYQKFFSEFMEKHQSSHRISSEARNGSKIVIIAEYKDYTE